MSLDPVKRGIEVEPGVDFGKNVSNESASRLHEIWKDNYLKGQRGNGGAMERWKPTGDVPKEWTDRKIDEIEGGKVSNFRINEAGAVEIDIAHTDYKDLTPKWQK